MIYIFHVDTGTMLTFEIKFATLNVLELKEEIELQCNIPISKQVLLVSGGEVLRPEERLCKYSVGTDTNPIFMFSKTIIEASEPPKSQYDYAKDGDYKAQVDACLALPPSYSTIIKYAALTEQFYDYARGHIHDCEQLVHDQHMQHQGWAAVVANMEDVTSDFKARARDFEKKCTEQLESRTIYADFLSRFNDDLDLMARIPILPVLRLNAAAHPFNGFNELDTKSESYEPEFDNQTKGDDDNSSATKDGDNDNKGSNNSLNQISRASDSDDMEKSRSERDLHKKATAKSKEVYTLLTWINIKENRNSLQHIADYCQKAMEIFDGNAMKSLINEINLTLQSAKKDEMKSISGLENRLSGLEKLMCDAQKISVDQMEFVNRFQTQKQNASNIMDGSLLATMCNSLRHELQVMLKNHLNLVDIKRRCRKAKDELAINLYYRLKWIVYVENRMFETDSKLMFYHRSLARLKRHLAAVAQLHKAPSLFCTAVIEIVRRRKFSQAFLKWASDLTTNLLTIHNEEVNRRRVFRTLFSGHFLGDLFPGTDDMPPPFATQPPKVFDADLPKLTQSDVDLLTTRLPNITPDIPLCDISPAINYFQSSPGIVDVSSKVVPQVSVPEVPVPQVLVPGVPVPQASVPEVPIPQVSVPEVPVPQVSVPEVLVPGVPIPEVPVPGEPVSTVVKESDRECKSEPNADDLDKIGHSPIDRGGGMLPIPVVPEKCDATTMSEVRSLIRQPPIKPPRVRVPTPIPLAPIPEAQMPQLECDCLLSPSLSTPTALSPRPPSPTSPTAAPGHRADFEPAEFYIEESPPETIVSKKEEMDKLKEFMESSNKIFMETICVLRDDLQKLKSSSIDCQTEFHHHFDEMKNLEKFIDDNATRERETLQRLTVDHELEMNDIKKILEKKDNEIATLKDNNLMEATIFKNRIKQLEDFIEDQNKKMIDMEDAKQKDLKELHDKLTHAHRIEVESLRSRFRLVACTTSMDRSPSESSLEKIERTDMIEISNHNSILVQAKEDMELEKEEALKRVVEQKDKEWTTKLAIEVENAKRNYDNEKVNSIRDTMKRIIDEKDRQLDKVQQRENQLHRDCMKYKETIEQLTDPETSDLNYLQAKLCSLEEENRVLKSLCKKLQEKEPPNKIKQRMSKGHIPLGLLPNSISITTCNIGDIVLVLWDGVHCNYTIFQESTSLFLLHGDCLVALDLRLNVKDEYDRRLYTVGMVEAKDYCVAVKTGNKYHVTVGQRFYRIKVKPLKPNENPMKDIAYCCGTVIRETDSSQNKAVMKMTASEAPGSYDSSSKNTDKCSSLTKSVYPVDNLTTSMRKKFNVFEPSDDIPSRRSPPATIPEASAKDSPADKIIQSIPVLQHLITAVNVLKEAAADVVDAPDKAEENKSSLEYNSSEWFSINQQDMNMLNTDEIKNEMGKLVNIEIQPDPVPYASNNENLATNSLSNQQIISEVAEEASP